MDAQKIATEIVDSRPEPFDYPKLAEMRDRIQTAIENAVKEERAKWLEALLQVGVSSHLRDHRLVEFIEMRVAEDGKPESLHEGMGEFIQAVDSNALDAKIRRIWDERQQAELKRQREWKCGHGLGGSEYCGECEAGMEGNYD